MKKRFLCALLALMMIVSLVPVTALNASAANMTTSDAAISIIKDFEGYSKYCKWDYAQWSIGYGTVCDGKNHPANPTSETKGGHEITEAEAVLALEEELEAVEDAVNAFATKYSLNLTQGKFDALVSFSYNCGTAWMNGSGTFKTAVINGTTGNDFLYAISLWANAGGTPSEGLLNRRLIEANMYLNGVYSTEKPENYTYVLFDGNSGTVSDKMQGYNSDTNVAIKPTATRKDYTFMGWYTKQLEWVDVLSEDVAGQTLYAHWQYKDANPLDHVVNYTLSASQLVDKQMYSSPSTTATKDGTVTDSTVKIVRDYIDASGNRWAKISMKGWVRVGATVVNDTTSGSTGSTGSTATSVEVTVTNAYINVRQQAIASSAKVGTVNYGEKLTITEVTTTYGALWGKCDKGWIALMYTDYDTSKLEEKEEEVEEGAIATAVVSCNTYVNIRKGAGMAYATCGTLKNGTKVTIFDIKSVNGHDWGKISTGWFCLDYANITMLETESDSESDSATEEDPNAEKAIASGSVINAYVNVRNGADVQYTQTRKLNYGDKVEIFEIKTVKGHEWGRISAKEWVCLDYVSYTMNEVSTDTETEEKDEETIVPTLSDVLFTGKVATSGGVIQVRAKPYIVNDDASTTDVNESNKVGNLNNGDAIEILDIAKGDSVSGNDVWVKVQITVDGKTVEGWISMKYVKLDASNYTVISNTLNVRTNPGKDNESIDKLSKGTIVAISDLAYVDENLWGYSAAFGGWMNITANYMERTTVVTGGNSTPSTDNTDSDSSTSTGGTTGTTGSTGTTDSTGILGTAVVNAGVQLTVRAGAGVNYANVGSLASGTAINIYEYVVANGAAWGRTDKGWVALTYVMFTSTGSNANATIANTYIGVNVRNSTSTGSTLLTKIMVNSRVQVLETKVVNGQNWARTALGWIYMDYVLMDSGDVDMDAIINGTTGNTDNSGSTGCTDNSGTTGSTTTVETTALESYAGTVKAATPVYATAGSTDNNNLAASGATLAAGDAITVYELATVTAADGTESYWASVEEGWIKAENVVLSDINQKYTITCNKLNIRKFAGKQSEDIGDLFTGDVITVTKLEIVGASIWGYVSAENGWVNTASKYMTLGEVSLNTNTETNTNTNTNTGAATNTTTTTGGVLYTGTVYGTASGLRVRQTPSTSGTEVGKLQNGTTVRIYEVAVAEYMAWGKCDSGWICLTYVNLDPNAGYVDARIVWVDTLAIRSAADAASELVGNYSKCTIVDLLEIKGDWGRTADGWIYMGTIGDSVCVLP